MPYYYDFDAYGIILNGSKPASGQCWHVCRVDYRSSYKSRPYMYRRCFLFFNVSFHFLQLINTLVIEVDLQRFRPEFRAFHTIMRQMFATKTTVYNSSWHILLKPHTIVIMHVTSHKRTEHTAKMCTNSNKFLGENCWNLLYSKFISVGCVSTHVI